MAERVLVTGGAGFIGLHLVRRLLADGARVTVVDDFSRGRLDDDLRAVAGRVEVVEHDLTRPLPPATAADRYDAVYHLAGVVGVARVTGDPGRVLRTNIASTLNILDWCARAEPRTIFLSSTSEVADGAAEVGLSGYPVPEDAPFVLVEPRHPRSTYALSKAVAEAMVLRAGLGCAVRVGRFHNVYGPRMGSSHVVPQFIERVLAGVDPFPIYGGDQSRAFCYIDDAVEATCRLMALPGAEPVVANIGDDREEIRIVDLARRLFAVAGVSPRVDVRPPPGRSPERRVPDLRRLRELTGFTATRSLDEGLAATLEWYRRAALTSAGRPA